MKNIERIEKNKNAIKNALINNCKGDVRNMSVVRLCKLANVGRTTFYNYYDGIHSVIEEMEKEYLTPIFNVKEDRTIDDHVQEMLKHPKEYMFLLNNSKFIELSFKNAPIISEKHFSNKIDISKESVKTVSIFIIPGFISLIKNILSKNSTITKQNMGKLFCIIEKHMYEMIEEYNAIE